MSVHYRALLHEAELTLAARVVKTGPLAHVHRHSARSHLTCVRLEIARLAVCVGLHGDGTWDAIK